MVREVQRFNVEVALCGQEALQKVAESISEGTQFKLVFMDVNMPVMDGLETTKRLLALCKQLGVEPPLIVVLTAYSDGKHRK